MLRWRLLLGFIFIAVLLGLFWLDGTAELHGAFLFPAAVVISVMAAGEMVRMLKQSPPGPCALTVYAGVLLAVLPCGLPIYWSGYPADCPLGTFGLPMAGLSLGLLLTCAVEAWCYDAERNSTRRAALAGFSIFYIGLPMALLVQLRMVDPRTGLAAVASLLIIVKSSDIGAYAVGRLIGKHPVAPRLSPKKTIEGLLGGLTTSALVSVLVFQFLVPSLTGGSSSSTPLWAAALYGVAIGIAGFVGDLAESMLKRDAKVKDSSNWLPGFGGVLDLLDSVLLAVPVALLCWVSGLVGG